jgi:hypothetical protein
MDLPRTYQLELSAEELDQLVTHLHRHLDEVDAELVRTDNPTLQHHIAHEVKLLEAVLARLDLAKSGNAADAHMDLHLA